MSEPITTISSFQVDATGWKFHGVQKKNEQLWETQDGDAVVLYFFPIPPNLPQCSTIQNLREFYSKSMQGSPAIMVKCGILDVANHPSILLLIKAPQKPSGFMYQGTYTLPFLNCSFVVKIQCQERGVTGMREAVLFDQRLKAGEKPTLERGKPPFPDWDSDAEVHDAAFPTHPASRVRRLLAHVAKTARFDEMVSKQPKFPLPSA